MSERLLRIQLLGHFRLDYGDEPVTSVDSPRLQSFLAYLLLNRAAPQSRQQLSFLYWPDSPESQARTNLRNLLYHLREALPDEDRFLAVDSKTLWWQPEAPFNLDIDQFEGALAQAEEEKGNQKARREALEKVVDAYGGDLLPSCYEDWIFPERERLKGAFIQALEQLIEILEERREYALAIKNAQRLLRHDELHEATYRGLMRLHALKGDTPRALRTYHTCVEVLEKELGIDPSVTTRDLYDQLLDLDLPAEAPRREAGRESPLVGRDEAWRELLAAWRTADEGAHFSLIKGEAGIGKTRLADEMLRWARKQGFTGAKTRSYPAEGELAYTPVTALLRGEPFREKLRSLEDVWLTEVARLLPELRVDLPDLPDPERLSESWKRQRLFEACARAILFEERALVLVVDDLQWCDQETLEWLRFLIDFDSGKKLLIVATLRTEELSEDSPLASLLSDLQRRGQLTEISLKRLDKSSTLSLAENVSGGDLEEQVAARLFRETEGNPLFVVEMVRSGLGSFGEEGKIPTLPPKVQAVIEARLNSLSPQARELANHAAVVGREYSFDLLSQTTTESEEAVAQGLDELWRRRVIREQGDEGYDFNHEKFREVIYQNLSPPQRIHLHRKVADALETIYADRKGEISSSLAHHNEQAARHDRAVDYYIEAGDQARRVYARQDAIGYYQRAVDLLENKEDQRLITIYKGLGDALLREARYEGAAETYQSMLASAEAAKNGKAQAQAWLELAFVKDRLGAHQDALECAKKAAEMAKASGAKAEYSGAVFMEGEIYYRLGDMQRALDLSDEALVLSKEQEDPTKIGECLNLIGLIYDSLGDYGKARDYKNEALALFREMDDHQAQWWMGNIYSNLANTAYFLGEFPEAVELYQKALEIMQEIRDRDWEKICLVNLGAALVGLSEYKRAEDDLRRVIELAAPSGWMGLSLAYFFLAEACVGQGKLEDALFAGQRAFGFARETGAQESLGAAWRILGKVASHMGEPIPVEEGTYQVEDCFRQSLEIFEGMGADAEYAHTLRAWAHHELKEGDKKRGKKMWAEAKEIFARLDMPAEVKRMEDD